MISYQYFSSLARKLSTVLGNFFTSAIVTWRVDRWDFSISKVLQILIRVIGLVELWDIVVWMIKYIPTWWRIRIYEPWEKWQNYL